MTDLQDFCHERRTMSELVAAGFKFDAVYDAVKRNELKRCKQHGINLYVSTVTRIPYNATLLVQAWNTQPKGETYVSNNANGN